MDANTPNSKKERYHVWKLRGKPRLWKEWEDEDGKVHKSLCPVTDEDLATFEGVERAKKIWKRQIIKYPCHYCGRPIEMTLDDLRFLSIHMLNRYEIGALPTCSKECAEKMVELYERRRVVVQNGGKK